MSEPIDLWGVDFDDQELIAPVTLLKEQASILGKKTKYILEAEINTSHTGTNIVHVFMLVARALDNYRYQLFRIRHDIQMYPVFVYWNDENYEAKDEGEFRTILGQVLSSEQTQRAVGSLLAQSKVY